MSSNISDPDDSVDIDRLADYIGGVLEGPDEAEVTRLIADDPAWRETYNLLAPGMTAVGAELGALGAEPMPADLAARLDQAFTSPAAEPTVIDPALATPAEPHLVPVRNDGTTARRRVPGRTGPAATRRGRLRWAAPIAVAAGFLGVAGLGAGYLTNRAPAQEDTAASSAGAASVPEESVPLIASGAPDAPTGDQILNSGTNYSRATLALGPAADTLGASAQARTGANRASSPPLAERSALIRLRTSEALRACMEAIARANNRGPITVETVDYAAYESRPALVVRFVAAGATFVWATGPDCGLPGRGADSLGSTRVG